MQLTVVIFLCGAVVTLIGWIITTRNAHVLAIKRDAANRKLAQAAAVENRKREFRAAIASIKETVLGAQDYVRVEIHQQSLHRFVDECIKIEPDIADAKAFAETKAEYLRLDRGDIECRDENAKRPPMTDKFGNYNPGRFMRSPPCRYNIGREKIKRILDALIKAAS